MNIKHIQFIIFVIVAALIAAATTATAQSSAFTRQLRIAFETRFIDTPALDSHVKTGLAMTCTSTNGNVWAGGEDSGQDCFDSAGALSFSNFCRLFCRSDEVVQSAKVSVLKTALDEVKALFEPQLKVRPTDNSTIVFSSTPIKHCEGMSVMTPINVAADIVIFPTLRPMRMLADKLISTQSSFCELVPSPSQRPAVVRLNIDPRVLNKATLTTNELKSLLIHEMVHSLGFHENMFNFFKHPLDVTKTYNSYSAASFSTGAAAGARVITIAAGNYTFSQGVSQQKTFFRGPATSAVAASFFACSTLTTQGVELENGGIYPHSVTHLEKRVFPDEVMRADFNGTDSATAATTLSSYTLAMLHDTGFYSAAPFEASTNYSLGATTFASDFGRSLGCLIAVQPCSTWPKGYFCSAQGGGCGYAGTFMGTCDLVAYPAGKLPAEYRWVPNQADLGGSDTLRDYCPRIVKDPTGDCLVSGTPTAKLLTERSGMYFGAKSQCIINRLVNQSLLTPQANFPGCFPVLCGTITTTSSEVTTATANLIVGGQEVVTCQKDNDLIELFPPPRANIYLLTRAAASAREMLSYSFHGQVACSEYVTRCKNELASTATTTSSTLPKLSKQLPTIDSVEPPWAHIDGGSTVTIIGARLTGCTGAAFGGIVAKDFKVINDTAATAVAGVVPNTVYGGANSNGKGDALVQLHCPLPSAQALGLCNPFCVAARKNGIFSYDVTDPRFPATERPAALSDFFLTIPGKLLGVCMSLAVTIGMTFAVRKLLNFLHGDLDAQAAEKKKQIEEEATLLEKEKELGKINNSDKGSNHSGSGGATGKDDIQMPIKRLPRRAMDEMEAGSPLLELEDLQVIPKQPQHQPQESSTSASQQKLEPKEMDDL